MLKKFFIFLVILSVGGFIMWPNIRAQIVDDNDQISLAKVKSLGNSLGAKAIDWLEVASQSMQQTSEQVAKDISTQSTELLEGSKAKIDQLEQSDTELGTIADQVESYVVDKLENVKEFVRREERRAEVRQQPPAQARARFSDLAPKELMMTETERTPTESRQFDTISQERTQLDKRFDQALVFKDDRGSLTTGARKKLDQIILGLEQPSAALVTIYGKSGSNRRMTFLRAQKVAHYFREKGVRAQALGLIGSRQYADGSSKATSNNSQSFEIVVTY